jgi:hypothetical protein
MVGQSSNKKSFPTVQSQETMSNQGSPYSGYSESPYSPYTKYHSMSAHEGPAASGTAIAGVVIAVASAVAIIGLGAAYGVNNGCEKHPKHPKHPKH